MNTVDGLHELSSEHVATQARSPLGSRRRAVSIRVLVWLLHMATPLLVLWLVVARSQFDVRWEHHSAHFWLVTVVAVINVGLGNRMAAEARRRADARLLLVSLAFLSSAGFLALHALATPNVILHGPNAGFVVATPVGLLFAAGFAMASSIEFSAATAASIVRRHAGLRVATAAVLIGWGVATLLKVPPLDRTIAPGDAQPPLKVLAVLGVGLYLAAAIRYFLVMRRRASVLLISLITAFFLLAEAMIAIALGRSWQVSWWTWHVLMLIAFGFVAYSAYAQYLREGSGTGLFRSISLERTIQDMQKGYDDALEAFVEELETGTAASKGGSVAAALTRRFDLTEAQVDVLQRAAQALATERDQIRHLGALVAVGQESSVIRRDTDLLARAIAIAQEAFGNDRMRLAVVEQGRLHWLGDAADDDPGSAAAAADAFASLHAVDRRHAAGGSILALPLAVKGHAAGMLLVHRRSGAFAERDRALLESLTSQLSIALENARLYAQLDGLFRQYMSPDVATALLADSEQAALGGAVVEVSALFADLRGFTPFSERTPPEEVVAVLNRYFGLVVPIILGEGGTVAQFIGDAVMALFNAPARQADHALRAARTGLAMQRAVEAVAREHPDWPRMRVGINTGPALIGNIGSKEFRMFTGIGDSINLASRLEGTADAGQVVIGPRTYAAISELAEVEQRAPVIVKGKSDSIETFVLLALRESEPRIET